MCFLVTVYQKSIVLFGSSIGKRSKQVADPMEMALIR